MAGKCQPHDEFFSREAWGRLLRRLTIHLPSTYNTYMKPIQVMFDEGLLERLDASEEVRREGRSAVLRRATAEFLQRRQQEMIADQYRKAYAGVAVGSGDLAGWSEEGSWPDI